MTETEITSVDQLVELPVRSVLQGHDGTIWVRTSKITQPWASVDRGGYGNSQADLVEASERLLGYEKPLTLVWRP